MVIRRGRFAHHDTQFTVKGRIGRRRAVGTARDVTGSCDSGVPPTALKLAGEEASVRSRGHGSARRQDGPRGTPARLRRPIG
jgi:hypothetical protein